MSNSNSSPLIAKSYFFTLILSGNYFFTPSPLQVFNKESLVLNFLTNDLGLLLSIGHIRITFDLHFEEQGQTSSLEVFCSFGLVPFKLKKEHIP